MKKVLFVISKTGYQKIEFNVPMDILEESWCETHIASLEKWECISWDATEIAYADFALSDVNAENYDLVVFVWWGWAYNDFIWNEDYYNLARKAKKVWAICIAPTIISNAWVLRWKRATGWDSWWEQISEMENNWAIFTWKSVEIDWDIITANWPTAAKEFGDVLLLSLRGA